MVAKSGCPVLGHRQVNSGHSIAISYGRAGFGLGNVSSCFEGWVDMAVLLTSVRDLRGLSGLQTERLKKGQGDHAADGAASGNSLECRTGAGGKPLATP